jgi:hypothetical protein
MNFPDGDIEVDAVEGDRRAEMFAHALSAGGRVAHAVILRLSFRDAANAAGPESITPAARCGRDPAIIETIMVMDSGLAPPISGLPEIGLL